MDVVVEWTLFADLKPSTCILLGIIAPSSGVHKWPAQKRAQITFEALEDVAQRRLLAPWCWRVGTMTATDELG